MNDFKNALANWDRMATAFKNRIDNQISSIDRLLAENSMMEEALKEIVAGATEWRGGTDDKSIAGEALARVEKFREMNRNKDKENKDG
jgi:hypothetical protein